MDVQWTRHGKVMTSGRSLRSGRPNCNLRASIDYLSVLMALQCRSQQLSCHHASCVTSAPSSAVLLGRNYNEAMQLTIWVSDRRPSQHRSFYLCLFVVLWGIMCVGGGGCTRRAAKDYHERQGSLSRIESWRGDRLTNASAPVTSATAVVNMSFSYNWPRHD